MLTDDFTAREIIDHIDPGMLDYQEWLNVGMALCAQGEDVSLWDAWSQKDAPRYRAGECARKWAGFMDKPRSVKMGTVIQYAREQGWRPGKKETECVAYGWDSVIGAGEKVVDENWIETDELPAPAAPWSPKQEVERYLKLLFAPEDHVGYVVKAYEVKNEDGSSRHVPGKGTFNMTAAQLIERLNKFQNDLGAALGDYDRQVGAWVRFNPLDGKGVKDANVTDYRYALIESDNMPVEKQYAILRSIRLPIAVLVHSGNKSLHAIVRVNAGSYEEYRRRVDELYAIMQKNGMALDKQNRNPSRLSRLPGFERGGKKQYIVAENLGCETYDEWKEYIESVNDDLPDMENLSGLIDDLPPLSPELIGGVLRMGHKMLVSGASKSAKSYLLIELCISIAEGVPWLGLPCAQGSVLYVNLELDRASCMHRFADVYAALKLSHENARNIDVWNLRGRSCPMDKLAPKLIRRALKKRYAAIVIDPIYKVITGDENAADQMAAFCNQFDKICTELGAAVIYCHHHSKGTQGQKRAMDRASGSGVFARDPDALLDLIELNVAKETREEIGSRKARDLCAARLDSLVPSWRGQLSQDEQCSHVLVLAQAEKLLPRPQYAQLSADMDALREQAKTMTAWRIESTLREFKPIDPIYMWFAYPVHLLDKTGTLKDVGADGEKKNRTDKATKTNQTAARDRSADRREKLENAIANANAGKPVTVKDISNYLSVSERSVRNWMKETCFINDKNTGFVTENINANQRHLPVGKEKDVQKPTAFTGR